MKTLALLILATLALVTWATTAFLVERRQERPQGAVVTNADYQRCLMFGSPSPLVSTRYGVPMKNRGAA